MTAPTVAPTTNGRCEGCPRTGPRWDLALGRCVHKLCAGCLSATQAVIRTEMSRPHMRGLAGDLRVARTGSR